MKISLDAAALCDRNNRFGNYVFTQNIIKGLQKYDKENDYTLYSFCRRPADLELTGNLLYKRLLPKKFWLTARVGLEEVLNPKNIFLALNQAVPPLSKARMFSFSHGLSYYFFKDLYQGSYEILKDQLFTMMNKSEYVFVSSKKVKKEMDSVFLKTDKIVTLPYGIPYDMLASSYDSESISDRVKNSTGNFFLYIGMNHQIKNVQFIVDAFKIFVDTLHFADYKLILVGSDFEEYKDQHKNIINLKQVNRDELKYLLQRSKAYLSASRYESFNLPILEALSQKCPVVALESAVIPELMSYVMNVKTVEEFVEGMKFCAAGRAKKVNLSRLKEEFSWNRYVEKLLSLFRKTS